MMINMRSYTHVLSLFELSGDNKFMTLDCAVEGFREDPTISLELNRDSHRIEVLFDDTLSIHYCETVYKTLFDIKTLGLGLHTNRFDLFTKYDQNYIKVSKLQEKMFKQSAKFNKAKKKLEKALMELV